MRGTLNVMVVVAFYFCLANSNLSAFGIGTGGGGPPPPPTIYIFSPTSALTYSTTNWTVNIGFGCSADTVTWVNNRGGTGSASQGLNWNIDGIPLQIGQNIITLYAYNPGGLGIATLTVIYTPPPPPKITIKVPVGGQRLTNDDSLIVSGNASGHAAVTNVWYQINNDGWQQASGTTNWTAGVTLTTRSNLVKAYAVDMAGSYSPTSSVKFLYIMEDRLVMNTNGCGHVTPNDNGSLLEVGKSYKLTASAVNGFKFTNWTGGTSLPLAVITNKATIQFLMQSNLILQANFVDVTRPKLTIASIPNQQKMTTTLAHVNGTAIDNWKINSVWYQLNDDDWNRATTTNSWKNWTAMVPLTLKTNKLKAYAVDFTGNTSTTNIVRMVSTNIFKLELAFASANLMTSNGLNLNLQASSGVNGQIQTSTDLVNWLPLTNFVGSNTTINFLDSTATNLNQRFYRAIAQ